MRWATDSWHVEPGEELELVCLECVVFTLADDQWIAVHHVLYAL
jgi:hypothetical protein